MTNATHLCPRCAVLCGSRCECGEDAIPRQPMPSGFTEGPPRVFQPMLADSPPQTDLTMLAYHEVPPANGTPNYLLAVIGNPPYDAYPRPAAFDGENEDGYD